MAKKYKIVPQYPSSKYEERLSICDYQIPASFHRIKFEIKPALPIYAFQVVELY